MKKWIKAVAFSVALVFAVPVSVPQCNQTVVQAATKAQKVKISKSKITIKEGDKTNLWLIVDGLQLINDGYSVKWSSSNKKVVSVSKLGRIKGISKGTATISAKFNKKTYKCKVIVEPTFNADEAKEKITFTPVETCNGLYKITSLYEIPTLISVSYKIIDVDGVTIKKSSCEAYAFPWRTSYIKIPCDTNEYSVQTTYKYRDCSGWVTKDKYQDKYEIIDSSLQLVKTEKENSQYDFYLKNTSDKKIKSCVLGLLIYDNQGQIIDCIDKAVDISSIDPAETIKTNIYLSKYQEDIGDIKFYIYSV